MEPRAATREAPPLVHDDARRAGGMGCGRHQADQLCPRTGSSTSDAGAHGTLVDRGRDDVTPGCKGIDVHGHSA
ncbi:hypothetical protein GCM10011331_01130 [Flavimobilis marinus]|nr:hypothetical protein GCM10011331_01130 [Flavimobilis marinus]